MNTHETYVSLEVAKLLKEVGFNWEEHYPRNFCYVNDNPELFNKSVLKNYMEKDDVIYLAPTLAVAQKWLREVKRIHIDCTWFEQKIPHIYRYCTYSKTDWYNDPKNKEGFDTYESALEAGINKCLILLLKEM